MKLTGTFRADAVQFRFEHAADDESASLLQTCVQVQRGDHGLEGVGEQGSLTAAAAALFAASQAQVLPQAEPGSDIDKMPAADQITFHLRKIALLTPSQALHY